VERYEKLLFEKDELLKEIAQIHKHYMEVFGKLIERSFNLKMLVIRYKKLLSLAVLAKNRGEEIDTEAIQEEINLEMLEYYEKLEEIQKLQIKGEPISEYELLKIKKVYRKISKRIHPDVHPELMEDDEIRELWEQAADCYKRNDLKGIMEAEIKLNHLLREKNLDVVEEVEIDDLEERIEKLKEEIEALRQSDAYRQKFMLEDPDLVEQKKEDLKKDIEDYDVYRRELVVQLHLFGVEVPAEEVSSLDFLFADIDDDFDVDDDDDDADDDDDVDDAGDEAD